MESGVSGQSEASSGANKKFKTSSFKELGLPTILDPMDVKNGGKFWSTGQIFPV